MGITAQIFQHLERSSEGTFGIHYPLFVFQWSEVIVKGSRIGKIFQIAEEVQQTVGMRLPQCLQKQAAEQTAEDAYRKKEPRKAGLPRPLRGDPAAGDHAVQVRMQVEILAPRMKYGEEADFRAQMFRVSCNCR